MTKIEFNKIHNAPFTDEERNYELRLPNSIIDMLVIHNMDMSGEEAYNLLTKPKSVSAHYLIREKGEIDKIVDEQYRAWHAGISYWNNSNGISINSNSIGIEIAAPGTSVTKPKPGEKGTYTEAQINSLIKLIQYIREKHPNITDQNIIGHSDCAPGRKYDPAWLPWNKLAENGIGIWADVAVEEPKDKQSSLGKHTIKEVQEKLAKIGYKLKIRKENQTTFNEVSASQYPKEFAELIYAFKLHHCPEQLDDVWDEYANEKANALIRIINEKSLNQTNNMVR